MPPNFRSIVAATMRSLGDDFASSTAVCRFSPFVWCVGAGDHHSERDVSPDRSSNGTLVREKIWRDFFGDPSQWWDHRSEKVNPRYPDFKHKRTGQGLWLDNSMIRPWVEAELATMAPGLLQSHSFSWNVKLRRHLDAEDYQKTLDLFQQMQREGITPDKFTFLAVLRACSNLRSLEEGRRVHEQIIQRGCESDVNVANCLVHMYAKCGNIEDAWTLFNKMREHTVVSWTAMIVGFVKSEQGFKALQLFRQMEQEGVEPDAMTFVGALNACASVVALEEGRRIHKQILGRGYESDVYVATCLVDMYAKCESIADAWAVFSKMRERNVVSWSAMIVGYVKSDRGMKALELFRQMQREGVEPNTATFVAALNACASVEALQQGRRVHKQIIEKGYESDVYVANCLVGMYAKCGSTKDARTVFNDMPERTVVSWSAMIGGYAIHGYFRKAFELFKRMCKEGVEIDEITFTCLLSACSHGGLVEEGLHYFETMTSHYNILPTREHYVCMVDLLGRAGRLKEAEEMAKEAMNRMPMERDSSVWTCLLGACRIHGNMEMGERAAKMCWRLDPENASTNVLLSNIYAAAPKWDRSGEVEKIIKESSRTWIEVKNVVHHVEYQEHSENTAKQCRIRQIVVSAAERRGQSLDKRFLSPEEERGRMVHVSSQ